MTTEQLNGQTMIVRDPKVRRGQPVLAGTGLRVADVAIARIHHDFTIDEIATNYGLSLAQVHAALSYYYAHHDEMTAVIRAQFARAKQYKEENFGNAAVPSR